MTDHETKTIRREEPMSTPRRCRWLGHRYYPDLLHCKRCGNCRGSVILGSVWVNCTRRVVDGKITAEHVGYRGDRL